MRGDPVKIKIGIGQAAVQNIFELPTHHPAWKKSLKILERYCAEARVSAALAAQK